MFVRTIVATCILVAGLAVPGAWRARAQATGLPGAKGEWEIKIRPQDYKKSRILVPYAIVGDAIPKPLTDHPGDPVRGRTIASDRDEGNCLACHSIPIPEVPFHGTIGPNLRGIGKRLTAGQLRLRIVDPKRVNPKTMMPSYYIVKRLYRVQPDVRGRPMLEAQDIEDLVAFLKTMTK